MNFFHILSFILFGKNDNLFYFWKTEVIRRDKFILHRLIREGKHRHRNYLMWWRLANEMYINGNKRQRKCAIKMNNKLISKFGCEIGLGARIGKGLIIPHHSGIVIHGNVDIGENFVVRQNTTIGQKDSDSKELCIHIGNNVVIGANSCILGLSVKIGDNVKIGAMSFVMENIPDNCTYVTDKKSRLIQ
ncbi:serine acetyltransferase [Salmonella enterica]|nr:serine acetyltransferase [Salmonella enterica]EAU5874296.1 serine acetyltransferase [Salmonella enterica]EDN6924425.1 serine acetyltransferase [Salmonella enterica]